MGLHDLELFDGQLARLEQDGVRYADLTNIVKGGRLNEGVDLVFRQIGRKAGVASEMFGQSTDIELGAANMVAGLIIAGLGQGGHGRDGYVLQAGGLLGATGNLLAQEGIVVA